ncbi:Protein kinase domain [Macleaya cordata]|uniref:mitogen-activated protein kinase kinase kinase n=1 Tax=Macleaya cordata TaxID=56857 RepID=A0A200Q5S1_MACCD|nr:Protein kinase domain [Macleaya cordata]
MPSWWGKSSSKEVKKKTNKESFIDTLQRKFRPLSEEKGIVRSEGSRRRNSDTVSERGSRSRVESRSPSPSKPVSRCQSFAERQHAQPLPLPGVHFIGVGRTDSGISIPRVESENCSQHSLFFALPEPGGISKMPSSTDVDGDLATASVSSDSSTDSNDPANSLNFSPHACDCENRNRNVANCLPSKLHKDQSPSVNERHSRESVMSANLLFNNQVVSMSSRRGRLRTYAPTLHIPQHSLLGSAPDSSMSSPSRSPMRVFGLDKNTSHSLWAGKTYSDVAVLGSGHCSSPGSGHNSGHNSMGGDMSAQLFWQHGRGSPECSPIPSPRMASPGPSSRINSGAVTPLHPRAGGAATEAPTNWPDDGKQQSHRLPLPPPNSSAFSPSNSPSTTPSSVPRSPGRVENPPSPGSRWKKGKLLGRGTFGHVYVGFSSESGDMCAMKEVTLFSDDAKSKESAKQLGQEISLLSRLRHQNIVQYYGSETVCDKLYIYLEYVSGGSIYKLLQDYGQLGESAIRSYTQQILSGLAYLHAKNTVHRDIKGANILVDPNGRVKLADFGMAKHITGQSAPLSFKGSPYWMAPEVIKNSNGCNLAVDIWSLGCTVLEMATTKPPWSQYEGIAAMFKIGNSKELPAIPDHLSDDGKDFVKQCLQRNPLHRPTAAQLLEHPFMKNAAPVERPIMGSESSDPPAGVVNGTRAMGVGHARNLSSLDPERPTIHQSRAAIPCSASSDMRRNISCPVSPVGSPLLNSRSPQQMNGRRSPSPISSPRAASGTSTPLTGGSNGTIPFHHLKQSAVHLHEGGFASLPMPRSSNSPSPIMNGSTTTYHHDPNPDLFRGMQQQASSGGGSHVLMASSDNSDVNLGKPFGIHGHAHGHGGDSTRVEPLYDGQSRLADRVSQQLLRRDHHHGKSNPSLDLNPDFQMLGRTNVI